MNQMLTKRLAAPERLDARLRLEGGVSGNPGVDRMIRETLDTLATRERELAEAERAMREVACPVENCEDEEARFVCYNDDADPIIEADTLADAIRQMARCWDITNSDAERLRADLAAVEAVEQWKHDATSHTPYVEYDGPNRLWEATLYREGSRRVVATAPTIIALGRELLKLKREAGNV